MPKISAGILLYRFDDDLLQVLLVHPGGPFWSKKDIGAWSIPKGELELDENPLDAAKRELQEEIGINVNGPFIELKPVKQKAGKLIYAWAAQFNFDATTIKSNTFEMEWPPNSGKKKTFPEVDKADWFNVMEAKNKINEGQVLLIEELESQLKSEK